MAETLEKKRKTEETGLEEKDVVVQHGKRWCVRTSSQVEVDSELLGVCI